MNPFQYVTAGSPDEAVSLVGANGRYLAGGIDLLGEMKDYIVSPDVLVNVKPTLASIVAAEHEIETRNTATADQRSHLLPALVTIAELAADPTLKSSLPGIVEAASEVGSPQIRNVASLGGNLLQHSRCWYYRQPDLTCLKRGGDTCYAQNGENKYSSLFSGCACISPIVSNLSVILTALDATVDIKRESQTETLSLVKLYHEAWQNPSAHNSLKPGDFLVQVNVPLKRTRSAYRQASEKQEFDWAMVSCAAAGNVSGGKITDARVVLGAVAPVPYMVDEANQFLEGKDLTDDTASQAADILLRDARPLAHNGYKVPLAHTLIRRTLLALNT